MLKDREYCAAPPMGELTAAIHINVAEIPDHAREDRKSVV